MSYGNYSQKNCKKFDFLEAEAIQDIEKHIAYSLNFDPFRATQSWFQDILGNYFSK